MYLEEQDEGAFRVYAAALAASGGAGYLAAVVVKRRQPTGQSAPASAEAEPFRCERLSRGRRWALPEEALAFAVANGVAVAKVTMYLESTSAQRKAVT